MPIKHLPYSTLLPHCVAVVGTGRFQSLENELAQRPDSMLLLDADVTLDEATLLALAEARTAQPHAVLSCRIADCSFPAKVQLPGWRWSEPDCEWHPEWCIEIKPDPALPVVLPCDWPSPEVLLIPRAALDGVGAFDPALTPQLAVIDWCLRARNAGFQCFEVQAATALKQPAAVQGKGPWGPTHLPDLPGMLILAHRHRLPSGRTRLALHFMKMALSEEFGRVRYWADYGCHLSAFKRTIWYLRNLLLAGRRAQMPRITLRVLEYLLLSSKARSWR